MAPETPAFRLSNSIVGRIDIGRLRREIQGLEDFLVQAKLRQPGESLRLPRTSRLLEEVARDNQLNLLEADQRQQLTARLDEIKAHAPLVQMSFAADPSAVFVQKIVEWLRREIHPHTLLQIGLQPGLAAGCTVRTANKFFDFSLRRHFGDQRQLLIDKIGASP